MADVQQNFDVQQHFSKYKNRKTGFSNIDEETSLYPGLYVIGAISSLGKTTFVHQLGDQLAEKGEHVLFFSLEQTRFEMVSKGISRITAKTDMKTAVSSIEIRRGSDKPSVKRAIENYGKIMKNTYLIECSFMTTINDIIGTVEEYIRATGIKPIVIIDYLQIIKPSDDKATAKDAVDSHVKALKMLQRDNDLVMFVVSSLNRMNYLTPVDFESFKESGSIEYSCDVLWGLQLQVMHDDIFNSAAKLKEKRAKVKAAKLADRGPGAPTKSRCIFSLQMK